MRFLNAEYLSAASLDAISTRPEFSMNLGKCREGYITIKHGMQYLLYALYRRGDGVKVCEICKKSFMERI
jgi:hypothetical protein